MLQGVKVLNKGERRQQLPVPIQLLPSMVQVTKVTNSLYKGKLYLAMIMVAFHGLLRLCEIMDSLHNLKADMVEILMHHFQFTEDLDQKYSIVVFKFGTSKTDHIGNKREWTWIASEKDKDICLVVHYMEYLKVRTHGPWVYICPRGWQTCPQATFCGNARQGVQNHNE